MVAAKRLRRWHGCLHRHHQLALRVVLSAALSDVALGIPFGLIDRIGVWNGLYFATTIGTTTGNSPYYPHGWLAYALAMIMHITVLPLWLASFTLMTSGWILRDKRTEPSTKPAPALERRPDAPTPLDS